MSQQDNAPVHKVRSINACFATAGVKQAQNLARSVMVITGLRVRLNGCDGQVSKYLRSCSVDKIVTKDQKSLIKPLLEGWGCYMVYGSK